MDLECILDVKLIEPVGILDIQSISGQKESGMLLMAKSYSGNFNSYERWGCGENRYLCWGVSMCHLWGMVVERKR